MLDEDKLDALTQLAGSVSHELNNIFTAVNGNLSLLEMALDPGGPDAALVNDVLTTTRRGLELSEQLQAFAGRQKLLRARVDLNGIVASTITSLKNTILHSIDVELSLAPECCWVFTDEEKLYRVIEELVRNAAAAMSHHGWMVATTSHKEINRGQVGLLSAGNYVALSIKDAGKGMSPDVVRRALDPLFSTKPGHRGWGLARSAGFIRQCGGNIVLDSRSGKGTVATVYLPVLAS